MLKRYTSGHCQAVLIYKQLLTSSSPVSVLENLVPEILYYLYIKSVAQFFPSFSSHIL